MLYDIVVLKILARKVKSVKLYRVKGAIDTEYTLYAQSNKKIAGNPAAAL